MFYVYILKCADESLYIGSTKNLPKRLREHNHLKCGAHYTKIRRPVILKYSEIRKSYTEARRREAELKRMKRSDKLKLIRSCEVKPRKGPREIE